MNKLVLILGPGRCGSSAVAGGLHAAGIPFPGDLIGANEHNPKGHWEDRKLHTLERLIHRILEDEPDLYPETWGQQLVPTPAETWPELRQLFVARIAELNQYPLWGLKSTMMHTIWPWVNDILPADMRTIIVHRDAKAVVRSRMKHGDLDYYQALRLHNTMLAKLLPMVTYEQFTTDRVLHVHYEKLLDMPLTEINRMLTFIDDDEPLRSELSVINGADWIEPALNRAGKTERPLTV